MADSCRAFPRFRCVVSSHRLSALFGQYKLVLLGDAGVGKTCFVGHQEEVKSCSDEGVTARCLCCPSYERMRCPRKQHLLRVYCHCSREGETARHRGVCEEVPAHRGELLSLVMNTSRLPLLCIVCAGLRDEEAEDLDQPPRRKS